MIDDFTRGASSVVPFAGWTAITTSEIVTVARESVARRLGRRNILQFYTTSKACLPLARDCLSIIWTLVDNISCARLFLTSIHRDAPFSTNSSAGTATGGPIDKVLQ